MDKFEQLLEYRTPIKDNDNKLLGKYWKPGSKYWHHKMFHLSISVTRQRCCQCRTNSNLKQGEMRNRGREAIPSCLSISGWSVMDDETQSLDINWSDRSQSEPGLISNPSPLPSVQHLLSTEYQYCVSASNGQFSIGHHPILEISILLSSPPNLPLNQLLELSHRQLKIQALNN